ncbi:phosphoribosylanthranilate isomerase [Candidatus Bathyarchaeota archaeon]|nr:phosphoribosylanthranilate isomerase [Candidatus Bathyarchaeota archaeon]
MVHVKICGITRHEDLKVAVDAGADLIGFIIGVTSSQRNLSLAKAKELILKIHKDVRSVAVTVFKTKEEIIKICDELETDYLQIHGNFQSILKSFPETLSKERIIGVVSGRNPDASELAVKVSDILHTILLDSTTNEGLGGTGMTHDWNLSRTIRDTIYPNRLILAGGLTPENVEDAIEKVRPYGVDVSTGVEKKPGIKDHKKIFDFITKVKEMEI